MVNYFHRTPPQPRLTIAEYLLEERNHSSTYSAFVRPNDYCSISVGMLFHSDSPFAQDLDHLFSEFVINRDGVFCKGKRVYELYSNWIFSPTLERIGKYLAKMRTFKEHRRLFTWLKPYCANLKSLHLRAYHDFEFPWYELVRAASPGLEVLHLEGFDNSIIQGLQGFAHQFPNLKTLSLYRDYRGFSEWLQFLDVILCAFGGLVESLNVGISQVDRKYEDLDEDRLCFLLRTHCPQLKDFAPLYGSMSLSSYCTLLQNYGSQVRKAVLQGHEDDEFDRNVFHQIVESCPNAQPAFYRCSRETLDCLRAIAPRIEGGLSVNCMGLRDTDSEMLRLCLKKLQRVTSITLRLKGLQAEQSLLLDALADVRELALEEFTIYADVVSATSLRKLIPVMPRVRKLEIGYAKIEVVDALLQVLAAAPNLQSILLTPQTVAVRDRARLLPTVSTFARIIETVRRHASLKSIELRNNSKSAEVYSEVREAVQCMRHRRVLLILGHLSFLYGKCVASGPRDYVVPE